MAPPPLGPSLHARLAVLITLVSLVVVGGGAVLQTRLYEQWAEEAIREKGRVAAHELARTLSAARALPSADAIHELLESGESGADVHAVGVLLESMDGHAVSASSSAPFTMADEAVARSAMQAQADVWSAEYAEFQTIGTPIVRGGHVVGATVATVSLRLEHELVARGRRLVIWFAVGTAVALVVLVTLVERKLIHQPLSDILATVQRYGAGDFSSRTSVSATDEIGQVATALNQMLARIDQLHTSLQERVDEATTELRRSNDDLVTSYQRMFALREALARAEQVAAAGQTAATLAHQLGTPLTLISGYVQVMLEDAAGDPRQAGRLRSAQDQIARVTGYIRMTLDAVRRPVLHREPLLPGALLRRLTETVRPRLTAARVVVEGQVDDHLPGMFGDPLQFELAMLNIVNNALDAMADGGTLTIVGETRGPDIHIEIRDTGAGIAPDLLPRIFDAWVTTKPAGQGTGLGLSIAREVVVAHGGRIDVRSTLGSGTTFTIDLPGAVGSPAIREA